MGITVRFLNGPSIESGPGGSPWVRYWVQSSRIFSGSIFPGELKREGLRSRILLGRSATLLLSIWGDPKASGLPVKEISGLGVWSQIALFASTAAGFKEMVPGTGEGQLCQLLILSAW